MGAVILGGEKRKKLPLCRPPTPSIVMIEGLLSLLLSTFALDFHIDTTKLTTMHRLLIIYCYLRLIKGKIEISNTYFRAASSKAKAALSG
jgi:hypothetical protein